MKQEQKREKRFWKTLIITQSTILLILAILTIYGYIEDSILIVFATITIAVVIMIYYLEKTSNNGKKYINEVYWKKRYILLGIMAGFFISFFGPVLMVFIVRSLGRPNPALAEGFPIVWITLWIIGPIIGGIAGYLIGKKREYKPIGRVF